MTPLLVEEERLPLEIDPFEAVATAYTSELSSVADALLRGLPVLVECEKELVPFFYRSVRDRLKTTNRRVHYLDGRPPPDLQPHMPGYNAGTLDRMLSQLRDAIRGAVDERAIVLPHLDLLTSNVQEMSGFAREVIALLYENPSVVVLGFRDPSFRIPEVVTSLFPKRLSILGVPRERLASLVTRREARKLGRGLAPYKLYKYVSGVNAVRLRRLLSGLDGEDYPVDPQAAFSQLRAATTAADITLPDVDLERDIGGYEQVKLRLRREILDVLARKDHAKDPESIRRIEKLVPRGMVFWGPPGTGKTLFAKAMATSLGAGVLVVSGPELKSKWVGESEENLRRVFLKARQAAPSVIVFDEIDSFASSRGYYRSAGVEHSMVNQLLTEMDGFRSNEMVFVVATTNRPDVLDPALLRPGRFEFLLHVPYPDAPSRAAILSVHDRVLDLAMTPRALDYAVRRTEGPVEEGGARYSGDHLQALCRAIARRRLRDGIEGSTEPEHVERALVEHRDRPALTTQEELVVATHEAGHAIVSLSCKHAPPIDRISIQGDIGGALGAVTYADPAHRYVVTQAELEARLAVMFGGREAEVLLFGDVSAGAQNDLAQATALARSMVVDLGMGSDDPGAFGALGADPDGPRHEVSEATRARADEAVRVLLQKARGDAQRIVAEERALLVTLRDLLVEKKVLDAEALASATGRAASAAGGAHG